MADTGIHTPTIGYRNAACIDKHACGLNGSKFGRLSADEFFPLPFSERGDETVCPPPFVPHPQVR